MGVNFGKASASASTTGIYLSTDATITTSDTLLTTVASASLTANGTAGYHDHQTVALNLSGSLAPGTYYIGGIADYTNAIAESNEANNNHEVTKIIVTGPAQPDLAAALMFRDQHDDRCGRQYVDRLLARQFRQGGGVGVDHGDLSVDGCHDHHLGHAADDGGIDGADGQLARRAITTIRRSR